MATAALAVPSSERQQRRRPFTSWVKRITNRVGYSDAPNGKKSEPKGKKTSSAALRNNPYPESGYLQQQLTSHTTSYTSIPTSFGTNAAVTNSARSAAPTLATNPETISSDTAHSKALTATTAGRALSSADGAGHDSTFSSPTQSVLSVATTPTTIQSTSPSIPLNQQPVHLNQNAAPVQPSGVAPHANHLAVQFSHQYPVSPTPASAIPPHLAPAGTGNPTTYSSATANNLLTDDASILTLASSSKRNRRRSMDTDASVRALAPSSVWGGSRESLPLSVLSGNVEHAQSQSRPSISGLASTAGERGSVYSSQGIAAPALASERNSFYATSQKPGAHKDKDRDRDARSIDGRSVHRDAWDGRSVNFDGRSLYGAERESVRGNEDSVRSGALGQGRNDSIPGSIGAPLGSPTPSRSLLHASRRSSEWKGELDGQGEER